VKRILIIVGILAAVILVAAMILPFVIDVNHFRPTIESQLSTVLGRPVRIGNLSLSLLTGTVGADDMSIGDDPAFSKTPFIRAKALKVGVEIMPLVFSKTLHVTELTLEKPEAVLLHSPAGKWNFSSLGNSAAAKPAATTTQPAPETGTSAEQNLSVEKLNIQDGVVSVAATNAPGKIHTYQNVNVTVQNFSFHSPFPFSLSADLPAGGTLKLEGTAGPVHPADASLTPLRARLGIKKLDLAASGFIDPASGISGLADFDGTVTSDGTEVQSSGTATAEKLKLSPKGSPAGRPVQIKYALAHVLEKEKGRLTQGDVAIGQAVAHLTGTYIIEGETTLLDMKLSAPNMPVNDLEAMLPALGVVLPSGSSLQGGTLSTTLDIKGPVARLVINGPIRLADSKLAGFDMGSKMSAISALSGAKTGSDTTIQNFSTDAHVSLSGIQTQNVNLTVPALGVVTGSGTVSPEGALDYKMTASLSGASLAAVGAVLGAGKGSAIPFFIQGTTANPKFVPDVRGMLNNQLGNMLKSPGGQNNAGSIVNTITGLFGKKKKPQ
jgi:AsmA protein